MLLHELEHQQFIRLFTPETNREKDLMERIQRLYDETLELTNDIIRNEEAMEYLDDKNIELEKEIERLKT